RPGGRRDGQAGPLDAAAGGRRRLAAGHEGLLGGGGGREGAEGPHPSRRGGSHHLPVRNGRGRGSHYSGPSASPCEGDQEGRRTWQSAMTPPRGTARWRTPR